MSSAAEQSPVSALAGRSRLTLPVAVVLSLLLHGLVFSVVVKVIPGDRVELPPQGKLAARPFEMKREAALAAGVDATTPAKVTWIGYDEYVEHYATPSETDQALMARGADEPATPGSESVAAEEHPPAEPETNSPEKEQAQAAERVQLQQTLARARETMQDAAAVIARGADLLAAVMETTRTEPKPEKVAAAETERKDKEPAPEPETASKPDSGGSTEVQATGTASDRDSPAASKKRPVLEAHLGKPLARTGVEIRTTRPQISVVRLWESLGARSPLAKIEFIGDGSVKDVQILESSGYRQVDEDIIDSLYEWSARGKQIEALSEKQSAVFIVRIMLH